MRICICMVSGTLMLWLNVCFPAAAGLSGSEIIPRTVSRIIDGVLHQPFKTLPQFWGVPGNDEKTEQEDPEELINPAQSELSLSPEQRRQLSLWFESMLDLMLGLSALVPFAPQNSCSDSPPSSKSKKVCLRPALEDFSSPPATDEAENDETEKRDYSEKDNPVVFEPLLPAASDTDVEITESGSPALWETSYLDNLPNEILKIITDQLSNQDLLSLGSTCRRLREFIDEQYPHEFTLKPLPKQAGAMPEFSPDSRYMAATVNYNHDVEVFINTDNGLEHKMEITGAQLKEETVKSLTFSPDSRYLIIRTSEHIWCLDLTGSNAFSFLSDICWRAIVTAFSPSGQYLIVDLDYSLQGIFYQCDGYLLDRRIAISASSAGFSPDDSCLAICTTEIFDNSQPDADKKHTLYLYNLPLSKTDTPDFSFPLTPNSATAVRFIDNDNLMIQDLKDVFCFQRMDSGWHRVFQYSSRGEVICFPKVGSIAMLIGNRVGLFWKSWWDGQWDLQQGLQYAHHVGAIALTPQGMNLGVGVGSELHLYTWAFDTSRRQYSWMKTRSLTDHLWNINTIAFTSSGQLLAMSHYRLVIYQHWFCNSWLKAGTYRFPAFPFLKKVLVSPDNSCIAVHEFNKFDEKNSIIWLFRVVLKSPRLPSVYKSKEHTAE